jgi:ABC-type multidrug transport system fused ATPase/permease subunit
VLLLLLAGLGILEAAGAAGHLASLGAVVLLLVRASNFGQMVQANYHSMQQSIPYLTRLRDAEARYLNSHVSLGSRRFETVPSIAFQGVTYGYSPNRPVLEGITFTVEPAEIVGVVGPTGAGKSTLVQLLLRLRIPQSGEYLVAGERAREWSPSEWTQRVSYIPQQPRLIHGTVTENIRFFRNLDQEVVELAARQAHIHDEIVTWPLGYETVVSERAKAVSGGQRQRLCLARALAGSPLMLILDEPTSALDPRSEALVQQSLAALKGNLTLFVVAHRPSTLTLCDRVIVLQDGKIEAFATTDEIVASSEFYNNAMCLSQSSPLTPPDVDMPEYGRSGSV